MRLMEMDAAVLDCNHHNKSGGGGTLAFQITDV